MSVNAYQPTTLLINTLARSGWGILDDRAYTGLRRVLCALTQAPRTKGTVKHFDQQGNLQITAWQLAKTIGMSERWTRVCLQRLEAYGLISWRRGKIRYGKATTSILRVSKKALVELIKTAKTKLSEAEKEHSQRLAIRLAKICKKTGLLKEKIFLSAKGLPTAPGQKPCSQQPELSADLSLCKRELQSTREGFDLSVANSSGGYGDGIVQDVAYSIRSRLKAVYKEPLACDSDRVIPAVTFPAPRPKDKDEELINGNVDSISPAHNVDSIFTDPVDEVKEEDMPSSFPKLPEADLTLLPADCPHGNYDPKQCYECIDATRPARAMAEYRRYIATSPTMAKQREYLKATRPADTIPDEWISEAMAIAKSEGCTSRVDQIKRANSICAYWQQNSQANQQELGL